MLPSVLLETRPEAALETIRLDILRKLSLSTTVSNPIVSFHLFLRTAACCMYNSQYAQRGSPWGFAEFEWEAFFVVNVIIPYLELVSFFKIEYEANIKQSFKSVALRTVKRETVVAAFASADFMRNMRDPARRAYFESDADAWALQCSWYENCAGFQWQHGDYVCNPFTASKSELETSAQLEMGPNFPTEKLSKTALSCILHDHRLNTGSAMGMKKAMFVNVEAGYPFEFCFRLSKKNGVMCKVQMFFRVVGRGYVRMSGNETIDRVPLF